MIIVLSAGLARILNQFTAIRLQSQMHSDQFWSLVSVFWGGGLEIFLRQKRGKVKFLKARRGDTNFFRRH